MNQPTNAEILENYLKRFRHSPQSMRMRKSSLNYFFDKKYFGYTNHVFDITKRTLLDYFDYLNHNKEITLITKKNKWRILKSFLEYTLEYYEDEFEPLIKLRNFPKNTITWSNIDQKESTSNKDVVMDLAEMETILQYLKNNHYTYYLIFRTFAETGMRKGELINIDYDKVYVEKRYIDTKGKTGRKIYYISKQLAKYLQLYLEERTLVEVQTKALFLSARLRRFSPRPFNRYLKNILRKIEITKNITCHTFRKSLNTFRKVMGCLLEDRKILLNHKSNDVNIESYVKLNYEQFITLYDRWDPYKNLNI